MHVYVCVFMHANIHVCAIDVQYACFQKCFVSVFSSLLPFLTVALFGFESVSFLFHTITPSNMGGAHVYTLLHTAAAPHGVLFSQKQQFIQYHS